MTTYTSVQDNRPTPATSWNTDFESILREVLPFLAADETLGADEDLRGLGLDSMGIVELLAGLEGHFGVRFANSALSMETFSTPGILWKTLASMLDA